MALVGVSTRPMSLTPSRSLTPQTPLLPGGAAGGLGEAVMVGDLALGCSPSRGRLCGAWRAGTERPSPCSWACWGQMCWVSWQELLHCLGHALPGARRPGTRGPRAQRLGVDLVTDPWAKRDHGQTGGLILGKACRPPPAWPGVGGVRCLFVKEEKKGSTHVAEFRVIHEHVL